jgi:hypothetical protein
MRQQQEEIDRERAFETGLVFAIYRDYFPDKAIPESRVVNHNL